MNEEIKKTINKTSKLLLAFSVIVGMMIMIAAFSFAKGEIWQGIADILFCVNGFLYIGFVKKTLVTTIGDMADSETDDEAEKTAFAAVLLIGRASAKQHECECDKEENGSKTE